MRKTIFLVLLLSVLLLVGCSSKTPAPSPESASVMPQAAGEMKEERAYDEAVRVAEPAYEAATESKMSVANDSAAYGTSPVEPTTMDSEVASDPNQWQERKIIKTADVRLESDTFDQTVETIKSTCESTGGFLESSNVSTEMRNNKSYKVFSATLRVPADQYNFAKQAVENSGSLQNSSESMQEVTSQFYDIQARLTTKEAEEKRLLELVAKAETIEDIISIEQRLGEVRADIEVFKAQLSSINSLSSFSTIHVWVSQKDDHVITIKSTDDFLTRVNAGFHISINGTWQVIQELIVFFSYITVPLIILLTAAAVILSTAKRLKTKKKERNNNEE